MPESQSHMRDSCNSVWGPERVGQLEYLRTFMRQLRKKLEDDPANPEYILTDFHFWLPLRGNDLEHHQRFATERQLS